MLSVIHLKLIDSAKFIEMEPFSISKFWYLSYLTMYYTLDRLEDELRYVARMRTRRGDLATAILSLPLNLIKKLTFKHDADCRETTILCLKLMLSPRFSDEEIEKCVLDAGWRPGAGRVMEALGKMGQSFVSTMFPFPCIDESCEEYTRRIDAWVRSVGKDTLRKLFNGEIGKMRQFIANEWGSLSPRCSSHREHKQMWAQLFGAFFPNLRSLQIISLAESATSARSSKADAALAKSFGPSVSESGTQTLPVENSRTPLMSQRSMVRLAAVNAMQRPIKQSCDDGRREFWNMAESLKLEIVAMNAKMDHQHHANKVLSSTIQKLKTERAAMIELNKKLSDDLKLLNQSHDEALSDLASVKLRCKTLEMQLSQANCDLESETHVNQEAALALGNAFSSLQKGLDAIGKKRPRYERFLDVCDTKDSIKVNL